MVKHSIQYCIGTKDQPFDQKNELRPKIKTVRPLQLLKILHIFGLLHGSTVRCTHICQSWYVRVNILIQFKNMHTFDLATLLLVTDVGEELCWRQLLDVGDGVGRYRQQHSLSFK